MLLWSIVFPEGETLRTFIEFYYGPLYLNVLTFDNLADPASEPP